MRKWRCVMDVKPAVAAKKAKKKAKLYYGKKSLASTTITYDLIKEAQRFFSSNP